MRFGVKGGVQRFDPTVDVEKHTFAQKITGDKPWVSPDEEAKNPDKEYYKYISAATDVDTCLLYTSPSPRDA